MFETRVVEMELVMIISITIRYNGLYKIFILIYLHVSLNIWISIYLDMVYLLFKNI